MGIWNKIWDVCQQKLASVIDEPFMSRSPEATIMQGRIADLDKKQREQSAMVAALQLQLEDLKHEKVTLCAYLRKLGRGIISKVRTEIKHVDAQIRENERRTQVTRASIGKLQISIKKITEEIRQLAGPMFRML